MYVFYFNDLFLFFHPLQPDDAAEDHWCKFCFGQEFLERLKEKRGQTMASTSSNDGEEDCIVEQQSAVLRTNGIPPLLSIVAFISQVCKL